MGKLAYLLTYLFMNHSTSFFGLFSIFFEKIVRELFAAFNFFFSLFCFFFALSVTEEQ
jgi:hypothetical protein